MRSGVRRSVAVEAAVLERYNGGNRGGSARYVPHGHAAVADGGGGWLLLTRIVGTGRTARGGEGAMWTSWRR